jgi:hypothetical protein
MTTAISYSQFTFDYLVTAAVKEILLAETLLGEIDDSWVDSHLSDEENPLNEAELDLLAREVKAEAKNTLDEIAEEQYRMSWELRLRSA